MLISNLLQDPMMLLVWVIAIVVAISVHEFAHALASTLLGDPTAKLSGRLTLNPMSHVSGMGFIMLLFVGFGWGKPVPFNPYNLKNKRFGPALVAIAGPLSNFILALISGIILKFFVIKNILPAENLLIQFLILFVILNVILMVFNLIPIPPLDGSKIIFSLFDSPNHNNWKMFLQTKGPLILLVLLFLDFFAGLNIFGWLFSGVINYVNGLLF